MEVKQDKSEYRFRMKHFLVKCFWCPKEFYQRYDTFNRQISKYGHNCCKHCFGKEKTFKDARTWVMTENNPFKGKTHSGASKAIQRLRKLGQVGWNKGLTKETSALVRLYAEKSKKTKAKTDTSGSNNPNWRGGISKNKKPLKRKLKEWMRFRQTRLEEDNFRCYNCGNKYMSYELEIHHLLSQTRYPESVFEPQNCFVFCKRCHRQFHKKYGLKKFTPMNAVDFINSSRKRENYFKFD